MILSCPTCGTDLQEVWAHFDWVLYCPKCFRYYKGMARPIKNFHGYWEEG